MRRFKCLLSSAASSSNALRHRASVVSIGALLLASSLALHAQSVTFTGKSPSVNAGNANLCKAGAGAPAPCSLTLTLDYKVTVGGTLGTPRVVTLGAPNLDFTLAEDSTCSGGVTTGSTCTVKLDFTPKIAGGRSGAVQILEASGKVLLTTPVYGFGIGPQIGTLTNYTTVNLPYIVSGDDSYFLTATPPAVDGAGNVYLAAYEGTVIELPADGSAQITLPFDFTGTPGPSGGGQGNEGSSSAGLAIDGMGDVFVTTYNSSGNGIVLELPGGGGPQITLPFSGLVNPTTIGVDGVGDIFVLDAGNGAASSSRLLELPFGCKSSTCQMAITSPQSISDFAVDVAGDLYLIYRTSQTSATYALAEFPAGGGAPIRIASNPQITDDLAVDGIGDVFSSAAIGTQVGSGDYELYDVVAAEFPANGSSPFTNQYLGYIYGGGGLQSPALALTVDALGNYFSTVNSGSEDQTLTVFFRSQIAPLNFGSVPVGSTSILPLEITNTGNRTLLLAPSFESPSYKIVSAAPSGCLAGTLPDESCTLYIQFSALTAGAHNISLTLGSNGAADTIVLLQAIATAPAK